ncbi:flavoprotein-domain-containing protein [Cercophora scortea]|uniref:Flavoprotein-domain-containing protein n=1 Tax=Cercophora scortea TaxID=314031 RepID=A0AAE0ILM9_9PEZI|nr:flavoprotein-domain-containing protein [Cercophora scortea]
MLQSVSGQHDPHFLRERANSIESLTASRSNPGGCRKHLLLAASGSVATIKIPVIIEALAKYQGKLSIRIILTSSARRFLNGQSEEQPTVSSLLHLPNVDAVYDDAAEWGPHPWRRGASILHIELRRWADIMVVAPLSANTLAKVVNGMSDNLLTSVIRAWDTDSSIDNKKKLIVVAPAMNSAMWRHPVTAKQMRVLVEDWGVKEPATTNGDGAGVAALETDGWFQVLTPISKTLACGDTGDGAMASVDTICETIEARLGLETD